MVNAERPLASIALEQRKKHAVFYGHKDFMQGIRLKAAADGSQAILVCPRQLERPWRGLIGTKRVGTLVFDVEQVLKAAGARFLQGLLKRALEFAG